MYYADARIKFQHVFTAQRDGHRKSRLDAAAKGNSRVPGVEADVRPEMRVGDDRGEAV